MFIFGFELLNTDTFHNFAISEVKSCQFDILWLEELKCA